MCISLSSHHTSFIFHVFLILIYVEPGTPLHNAAKERNRRAVKYLIENGAFLPDDINDTRFNPPLHYCPGLEWAYEEMERLQQGNTSSCESSNGSDPPDE